MVISVVGVRSISGAHGGVVTAVATTRVTTAGRNITGHCISRTGLPKFHPNGTPTTLITGGFTGDVTRRARTTIVSGTCGTTVRRLGGSASYGLCNIVSIGGPRFGTSTSTRVAFIYSIIPTFALPRCGNVRLGTRDARIARRSIGTATRHVHTRRTRFGGIRAPTRGNSCIGITCAKALRNTTFPRSITICNGRASA